MHESWIPIHQQLEHPLTTWDDHSEAQKLYRWCRHFEVWGHSAEDYRLLSTHLQWPIDHFVDARLICVVVKFELRQLLWLEQSPLPNRQSIHKPPNVRAREKLFVTTYSWKLMRTYSQDSILKDNHSLTPNVVSNRGTFSKPDQLKLPARWGQVNTVHQVSKLPEYERYNFSK